MVLITTILSIVKTIISYKKQCFNQSYCILYHIHITWCNWLLLIKTLRQTHVYVLFKVPKSHIKDICL